MGSESRCSSQVTISSTWATPEGSTLRSARISFVCLRALAGGKLAEGGRTLHEVE